ncbi:SDR family oxidoreductase [Streptomyces sp. NPDC058989]|uniref:SDR family oxidoreductase n=1 Tax=Streptomyces sp. NPDC058989 TaxID=3346686 RepID=UPI0036B06BA4
MTNDEAPAGTLDGRVALVAGATRGAGRAIAVELARAGAFVYATGRSSRTAGRSEIDRPETIEETGDLIVAAGGSGTALRVDHLDSDQVADLVRRVDRDHGRLDLLVNDIFGGDRYAQFGTTLWEHDLAGGLRILRMGIDTHAITSHHALPLLIRRPGGLVVEMTDGTAEYNAAYRHHEGFYYDLVKAAVQRMTLAQSHELAPHRATAVAVTPGWLRSEHMLEAFGVTEDNWRDATADVPHFCISESPAYVARAVTALAADPDVARWSGKVVSSGQLAPLYGFTDTDGTRPDCWRYLAEVQSRGLPADDTGYR